MAILSLGSSQNMLLGFGAAGLFELSEKQQCEQ
jgi:hypothetical protein